MGTPYYFDGSQVIRALSIMKRPNLAARNKAERGSNQAELGTYIKRNVTNAQSRELTGWHEREIQER